MAKRKRLSPALIGGGDQSLSQTAQTHPERAPIAHVAADAAGQAAFEDVARALAEAREEGRLIVKLPISAIETDHLVRDRIAFDDEEMAALKASLEARGQQVPIEVTPLDAEGRYGLISGLRRVMALGQIGAGEVLALVRQPESSAAAYLAMVEENEIRSGISFYERARLAAEAVLLGLFETPQAAIAALFPQASAPKRSKIGSFVTLHDAIGDVLRFPTTIPERLGLALVKALASQEKFSKQVRQALEEAAPTTAEEERIVLDATLQKASKVASTPQAPREVASGIHLETYKGKIVLSGGGVTEALRQDLETWLATR